MLLDRVGTDGRVARLTLNRPDKLNALSPELVHVLYESLRELEADSSARVIVLRGAGRAFSAGWDIGGTDLMASPYGGDAYAVEDRDGRYLGMNFASGLRRGAEVQQYLWGMPKIVVSQLHGYCIAGGLEFAMMCDFVTAANDCVLGHPGSRAMGVARNAALLPLLTGMRKAKELLVTGDSVTGADAERLGLVNYAWPAAELDARTIAFADRIAIQSADHLAVLKAAANRFHENMGIHSTISSVTQLDALGQTTESGYRWQELLAEDGIGAAVAWRDEPYGDYSARVEE